MTSAFELGALRYPRSFLNLLLLGFSLVSLPLVLALLDANTRVGHLSSQSQLAVDQAAQAARGSRVLMEQVTAMERIARQFLILEDTALLEDYASLRRAFKRTTSELSLLPLDASQLRELNLTIDREQALFDTLQRKRPGEREALLTGYVELSELANTVLVQSNRMIDREIDNMGSAARGAQARLLWQLAAALPLGVLIAALFAFLIARPIRELDHAIRRLGDAEFAADIRVHGPADLQHLGRMLDWLRRRLADLEQQKTRFLRHVSHELKTPLTALREGSELLADGTCGALTDSQREIAEILRHNSLRLQRMIEGMLEYQQALDSVSRLNLETVEPGAIAREVVEAHKLALAARNLRVDTQVDAGAIEADAEKLRVIVDNLMSNAIKYSPAGGTITLVLRRSTDMIALEVGDAGPGVAPEDRERIFDWFFQSGTDHEGRVKGSGLGLAIAREFVLAHRGQIELVAAYGQGAHFRVSLPLAQARRAITTSASEAHAGGDESPRSESQ